MILRCKIKIWSTGDRHWTPIALEDDKVGNVLTGSQKAVFLITSEGQRRDLRDSPPFYQILPCPYCGVVEDKGHDPLSHVDTHLNTIDV